MLNASMPFDDSNLRKLLKDQMTKNWVFRSRVRDTLSSSAKSLVRHLLEPDLTQRLTLDRVIQHEWLRMRKDRPSSLIGRLVHSAPHGQNQSISARERGIRNEPSLGISKTRKQEKRNDDFSHEQLIYALIFGMYH
ncbi:unnamed protein product [Callosobruchus maculatus]|uniref:Protein kinase domain-containing protein n=1 Tax=Callosobruchus maculatus TaxID=64391 RepID=A0A653BMV9_CALMS|nr:unnamed protein product [Callosobruchus maculatus]